MGANKSMSWTEARQIIKERNISEEKFREWLIEKDAGASPKETLELIVNHVYHSTEEHLYAPPHLRGKGKCCHSHPHQK